MVHVRVEGAVKEAASKALEDMGLSVSMAVNALLKRIAVEKRIPFELKVPSAETRQAMLEAEELVSVHQLRFTSVEELFNDLEKNSRT
jgi:DNA-damage-inducible protein J